MNNPIYFKETEEQVPPGSLSYFCCVMALIGQIKVPQNQLLNV